MSLSAPATSDGHLMPLAYLDVVLLVVAAPIMLLIGVPAVGYLVGAGAWIVLARGRRRPSTVSSHRCAIPGARSRCGSRICSDGCSLLAIAVILVRNGSGRDDGLTALHRDRVRVHSAAGSCRS